MALAAYGAGFALCVNWKGWWGDCHAPILQTCSGPLEMADGVASSKGADAGGRSKSWGPD